MIFSRRQCLLGAIAGVFLGVAIVVGMAATRESLTLIDLGPAAPFLVLLIGLVFAGLVATLAIGVFVPKGDGGKRGREKKVMVWFLVGANTFSLWGSSSGEGGPVPGGGTTGYTYCGILHYMTVSSRQAGRGAPGMHDLQLHPWPLVGTIALTGAACIVIAVVTRWSRRIA